MSLPFPALPQAAELTLLVAQVGDTEDHRIQELAPVVWDRYAYADAYWPGLRLQYAKRDLLEIAWATVREAVSFSIGAGVPAGGSTSMQLSDKARAIQAMRGAVQDEIVRLEARVAASYGPRVGQLRTQGSIGPPWPGMIDGNSPTVSGSVYRCSPIDPPVSLGSGQPYGCCPACGAPALPPGSPASWTCGHSPRIGNVPWP